MQSFDSTFGYKLIYIFRVKEKTHEGCLKIGDTTIQTKKLAHQLDPNSSDLNKAAKKRIDSYMNTAGIPYELLHTELAITNPNKKGEVKAFRDYQVHNVLKNSGIKNKKIEGTKSKEWFKVSLEDAKKAIKAVKDGLPVINPSKNICNEFSPIDFRPEQKEAIKQTINVFKKSDRMLWNAKMRFGKTVSALQVVKEMNLKRTIIITHRPAVDSGWNSDFKKVFYDKVDEYEYGSKSFGKSVEYLESLNKNYIYFSSIQDLRGSSKVGGKFDKNQLVFKLDWDLLIVDEAHEGTQTELGKAIIEEITKEKDEHRTKCLALSGTPFNIIDDYESEDNIYTWDYVMEQRAKHEWDKEHFGDSNPYEELPELKIYTYDLGKVINSDIYQELEDKAFNFKEFFRVWTGNLKVDKKPLPKGVKVGDFYHKDDVWSFLNLITKKDTESNYPYANEEYRNLFKHSLWKIPGVKEAKALSKMMKSHPVFGSGMFDIVNIAGDGDEEEKSEEALKKVRNAIDNALKLDRYTITLSCGKLTTGVTVPEWTAVMMLSGSYSTSASSYLQTIFRVQSPANINGKIKKNCYVFDFAPDRTLKMVADGVQLSASKPGKTKEADRYIMGEFLNYCPVISVEGTLMKKYDENYLLQQLKKAYADKVVKNGFDDKNLYNDELLQLTKEDLKKFEKLSNIIGKSKQAKKLSNITINDSGFDVEDYEKETTKKSKKTLTPEEEAKKKEMAKRKKMRDAAISNLRAISIRIPLLIYGTDINFDENFNINEFADKIDPSSWEEFMPKGIDKNLFKEFSKYYDMDVFIAAGRKIHNIVRSADRLSPIERTQKIAQLFSGFKNPDKETVLTPWKVVNMHMSDCLGGYTFYDKDYETILEKPRYIDRGKVTSDTLGNKNAKILEINSKTGLYPLYVTCSIYCCKCKDYSKEDLTEDLKQKLWLETVQQNIFVVCKTEMAKAITERTLVGFKDYKANTHCFKNLINQLENKSEHFIEKIKKTKTWPFKGGGKMEFNAIVGNPPYQVMDGGNGASSKPVYQYFIDQSKKLNPNYISMIMPSRWFAGGKGLDTFRNEMLNDKSLRIIHDFTDSKDCFPNVEIKGGVCYFLWDKEYNDNCEIYNHNGQKISIAKRPLLEKGMNTFIRYNESVSIYLKVKEKKEDSFSVLVNARKPFGIPSNFKDFTSTSTKNNTIKIFANKKTGFVSNKFISQNIEWVNKYKIYISESYGAGEGFPHQILNKPFLGEPNTCCTETYLVVGPFDTKVEAENVISYMKTKFFRFMVMLKKISQHATSKVYECVPIQDFSKAWTDKELYLKYNLNDEEICFIEEMIKIM